MAVQVLPLPMQDILRDREKPFFQACEAEMLRSGFQGCERTYALHEARHFTDPPDTPACKTVLPFLWTDKAAPTGHLRGIAGVPLKILTCEFTISGTWASRHH
jgi:hypothetical protein